MCNHCLRLLYLQLLFSLKPSVFSDITTRAGKSEYKVADIERNGSPGQKKAIMAYFIMHKPLEISHFTFLFVNQMGTVTEAIEVVKMAKDAEWGVVISQRSGETDYCFIADLAIDLATGQIKAGAPSRGSKVKEKQNHIQTIPVLRTGRT
ncbi:hypothetical protein L2E82_35132 [Cichorium intybus]|uniref:Uncharacterized protein n=1 Tax=Cichorium intybus TaxID=13427 RepID=A0ACB9BNC1_CICIN|nr:hypothetical protein L2E82_35132 [Cichorium intybus]